MSATHPQPQPQQPASEALFRLVPFDNGGWEDLLVACTDADLRSEALSPDAYLDTAPYIKALMSAGMSAGSANETRLRSALEECTRILKPRIVQASEFGNAVSALSQYITSVLLPGGAGDRKKQKAKKDDKLVFVCESFAVKSNLWVFMLLMRDMSKRLEPAAWSKAKRRIFLMMQSEQAVPLATDKALRAALRGRMTVIATDDCAYSGSQLAGSTASALRLLDGAGANVVATVVCPLYSTFTALRIITKYINERQKVTLHVPNTIGFDVGVASDMMRADVALCVRRRPGTALDDAADKKDKNKKSSSKQHVNNNKWAVTSLFRMLGICHHYADLCTNTCNVWIPDSPITYSGKELTNETEVVGHAAVVFAHKVADQVSIPTRWILQGPTLRHLVSALDQLGSSADEHFVEFLTLPFQDMLRRIDYDPANAARGARWARSPIYQALFVVDAAVLEDGCGSDVQVLRLAKNVPEYVPLLQPPGACGDLLKAVQEAASDGDWWESANMNQLVWKLEGTGAPKLRCVSAPYKANLRERLLQVAAKGKAAYLLTAMGISSG